MEDHLLVFTTHHDKKAKTNSLYLHKYTTESMQPVGRMELITTIDLETMKARVGVKFMVRNDRPYLAVTAKALPGFSLATSPNNKVICVYQDLPYNKTEKERFKLKVFDDEMQPLWDRDLELPYLDSEFSVESGSVTDDGSVMIIGNKFAEKREAKELKKDKKATYEYHLLIYHGDGAEPEDHPIAVSDKFIQDLTLNVDSDGDILCGGFYGNKGTFAIRGAFFLRLDNDTKEIVHSSFKEFDNDFITEYMTEKEEKKATNKADRKGEDVEMSNYELRDLIRREDGGAVMVGEQYRFYETTTTTTNANGGSTTRTFYHYVYNDIIVVNIDPQGDIEWAAKVPKRQHSVNDGGYYSSFAIVVTESNIHLVFNDSGKNLFLKPGDKVEPFKYDKEMLITLATINEDGRVYREALLSQEKRDAILRPKSSVQVGDDRLFIYADWKKDYRFGTVKFQ
jgi:hypothetical protein